MMRNAAILAAGVLAAWAATASAAVTVEVSAGKHARENTPVFLQIPADLQMKQVFALTEADTGRAVDVQRLPGSETALAWILREPLAAGQTRRYRLEAAEPAAGAAAPAPAVTCAADGKRLLVKVQGRPALQYNIAVVPSPAGLDEVYARSGHIHPLFNPAGQAVTDDFPPDHAHQHGLFFAWVNTTFEGRNLDFWNQVKKTARIGHAGLDNAVGGNVFGQFVARLRHDDITTPDAPKAVLDETWTVRVYNVADLVLVDLQSTQRCASASPLAINEFNYGGMALRGAREWYHQKESDFLTSEGKTRADGNATRARWVEMHGLVDGRPSGVIAMTAPDNFRAPEPVRLHPDKPYFCFAPMILGEFTLEPGKQYTWRYRYAVHMGKPDAALAERLWRDFAEPPEARVVAE